MIAGLVDLTGVVLPLGSRIFAVEGPRPELGGRPGIEALTRIPAHLVGQDLVARGIALADAGPEVGIAG